MSRPYRTPLRDRVPESPLGSTAPSDHDPEPGAVARYQPQAATGRVIRVEPVADLAPKSVDSDLAWAKSMAQAGIAPAPWNNPHNILWAIGYARALNISVIAAMQGIYISRSGRPTMNAQMMGGLVRREGHRLYVDPADNAHLGGPVRAAFIRKEEITNPLPARFGIDPVFRAVWDLDKAARARLVRSTPDGRAYARSRDDNPLPWELYPEQMLVARAISEVLRRGAQDVLLGVVYTPEELGEEVDADGVPVHVDPSARIDDDFFGVFEGEGASPADTPPAAADEDANPFDDDPHTAFDEDDGPDPDDDGFDPATATAEQWRAQVDTATDRDQLIRLWYMAGNHTSDPSLEQYMAARASTLADA